MIKVLPESYLARNVPGDYDGSWALPNPVHEKFSQLVASGAQQTSAIIAAHPKGGSLATPVQSSAALARKEQVKRRIRFLREHKAMTLASEDSLFSGFVHAVESAMTSISDLVLLCQIAGLPREAAAARAALGSLAGRTFMHRDSLTTADNRGAFQNSSGLSGAIKEFLS